MPPDVSAVIPVYNRPTSVVAAIESVLAQDGPAVEVLVVDDGSTDDTADRVGAMADSRVKLLRQPHSGSPAKARNLGARSAAAELVAFCDSDDRWLPGKIAAQVEVFRKAGPELVLVSARARVEDKAGNVSGRWPDASHVGSVSFDRLLSGNVFPCSATVVRRSAFERAGGFREDRSLKIGEDYDLWLRILRHGVGELLPAEFVVYVRHAAAMTARGALDECASMLHIMRLLEADRVPRERLAAVRTYWRRRAVTLALSPREPFGIHERLRGLLCAVDSFR